MTEEDLKERISNGLKPGKEIKVSAYYADDQEVITTELTNVTYIEALALLYALKGVIKERKRESGSKKGYYYAKRRSV